MLHIHATDDSNVSAYQVMVVPDQQLGATSMRSVLYHVVCTDASVQTDCYRPVSTCTTVLANFAILPVGHFFVIVTSSGQTDLAGLSPSLPTSAHDETPRCESSALVSNTCAIVITCWRQGLWSPQVQFAWQRLVPS